MQFGCEVYAIGRIQILPLQSKYNTSHHYIRGIYISSTQPTSFPVHIYWMVHVNISSPIDSQTFIEAGLIQRSAPSRKSRDILLILDFDDTIFP